MSGKTVVVNFVKTESYRIMFDIEDVTNSNGVVDPDLIEELCWEEDVRNTAVLIGASSHVTFEILDNPNLENC